MTVDSGGISKHYQGKPVAYLTTGEVEVLRRVVFPGGDFVPGIELSAADILSLVSAFEEALRLDTPPTVSRVLVTAIRDGLRVGELRDLLDLMLAGKKPCPACLGEGYVPSDEPGNPEEDDADGSLIPCEACGASGAVRR
jgi:hypothetical protein